MSLSAQFSIVKMSRYMFKKNYFKKPLNVNCLLVFFLVTLATVYSFHYFFIVQPLQWMTKIHLEEVFYFSPIKENLFMSYLHYTYVVYLSLLPSNELEKIILTQFLFDPLPPSE